MDSLVAIPEANLLFLLLNFIGDPHWLKRSLNVLVFWVASGWRNSVVIIWERLLLLVLKVLLWITDRLLQSSGDYCRSSLENHNPTQVNFALILTVFRWQLGTAVFRRSRSKWRAVQPCHRLTATKFKLASVLTICAKTLSGSITIIFEYPSDRLIRALIFFFFSCSSKICASKTWSTVGLFAKSF